MKRLLWAVDQVALGLTAWATDPIQTARDLWRNLLGEKPFYPHGLDQGQPKPTSREILALGWLSSELATRADAWSGNAPDWFPEPPEWLELWQEALTATWLDRRR